MTREEVTSILVSAFSGMVRDESCTLHEAQLIDQSLGRMIPPAEFDAAKRLDIDQKWQNVPAAALDECDAALSHLSHQGWRFYIPAYIARTIDLLDHQVWTWLPGAVIFHLTYPTKDVALQFYALDRFKGLDESQILAVAAFLRYAASHQFDHHGIRDDAQVALTRFWGLPKERRPDLSLLVTAE